MTGKTVVVAHRAEHVRQRFADALGTAGHRVVCVEDARDLRRALEADGPSLALVLLDGGLARPSRDLVSAAGLVVIFAGSVDGAADVRAWAEAGVREWVNEHSAPHQVLASLAPLLFRENFDRRATPRVAVAMPVTCVVGGIVTSATALNIGGGGLGLRPLGTIPVGESLRVRFRLPALKHDVEVEARVCWTDVRHGIGVQFERIGEADAAAVDAFVERHLPRA